MPHNTKTRMNQSNIASYNYSIYPQDAGYKNTNATSTHIQNYK